MKAKESTARRDRLRLTGILTLSILVVITGALFAITSFRKGEVSGGILGALIALTIVTFAFITYRRGTSDLKNGFPIHDERSRRVVEKASSKAFHISLYLLLAIGFLSDGTLKFRDASQAIGAAVGGMALLFLGFWLYYNKREL